MKAAGLPTPANAIIRRPSDLAKAARIVGFPAVIKPTSGAASLGVIRVDNEPDLHRWSLVVSHLRQFKALQQEGLETEVVDPCRGAKATSGMRFARVHIIMCC